MYKEFQTFTLICDNCGKDSNAECEYCGWDDKDYVLDCAKEDNWIEENDKHYCPDCYEYDDEDNLVLKSKLQ